MKADGDGGDAARLTANGGIFGTPDAAEQYVYLKKESADKELWRVPAGGGQEELLSDFTQAGFTGSWIMQKAGILFLARTADQQYQFKFYDFAERVIVNAPEKYSIPSYLDANCATTDGKVILCSALERSSHLTLADLR